MNEEPTEFANILNICMWDKENYSYVFALSKWVDICASY